MTIDAAIGSVKGAVDATEAITSGLDKLLSRLVTIKDRKKARDEYYRISEIVYTGLNLGVGNVWFINQVEMIVFGMTGGRKPSYRLTTEKLDIYWESEKNSIPRAVEGSFANEGSFAEAFETVTSMYLSKVEKLAELLAQEQRLHGGLAINETQAYLNIKRGLLARRQVCAYLLQADLNNQVDVEKVQQVFDLIAKLSSNLAIWIERVAAYGILLKGKV